MSKKKRRNDTLKLKTRKLNAQIHDKVPKEPANTDGCFWNKRQNLSAFAGLSYISLLILTLSFSMGRPSISLTYIFWLSRYFFFASLFSFSKQTIFRRVKTPG